MWGHKESDMTEQLSTYTELEETGGKSVLWPRQPRLCVCWRAGSWDTDFRHPLHAAWSCCLGCLSEEGSSGLKEE